MSVDHCQIPIIASRRYEVVILTLISPTKYFGCAKCVNNIWDEDGDGLTNIQEFILGSDPKNKDSNSNGINDYEELLKGQNIVTSQPLSAPYILASKSIIGYDALKKEGINSKISKQVRDASLIYEAVIPKSARFLIFNFGFEDLELSSYFTVFFNNKLLYETTAIPGQKINKNDVINSYIRTAFVPVDLIAGQRGILTFTLNSVGIANTADIIVETENMYFK